MPEKPEVLTVVSALRKKIIGKKIINVDVLWDNIIVTPSVSEFKDKLKNQVILSIDTRGKWILIHLSKNTLIIHLRMEGKFFFREHKDPINKHEHVIFTFDDNTEMRCHDVRKFGKMHLLSKDNYLNESPLKEMGYEYYDSNLNENYLYNKLQKKSISIKTSLLDQSIITGIGNIYDDEILFLSNISPLRKSNTITKNECRKIINNTKKVLDSAIELGGTTIKSFTSSEGVHGLFQNKLLVHGKNNEKCPVCNNMIKKIKINGRGTYYCENCQK